LPSPSLTQWQTRLRAFAQAPANASLNGILRGLEKESLRVDSKGKLAQTSHQKSLGSAFKHPHITTDYSEALLEFITEPFNNIEALLEQLDNIHRFTYQKIAQNDECLWPASMPCNLPLDSEIPVARYGNTNAGIMKTIYRVGLGHRYGRSMQTIAGIHYNFSLPDDFWRQLQELQGNKLQPLQENRQSLQDFKTEGYFNLIRNFRRNFWLLIYLFGAAPAVSDDFVADRKHRLQPLAKNLRTHSLPYATSLRMGDLGYQSDAQQTLFVCYNNLNTYLKTLCGAITKSHPAYEKIGVKNSKGEYQQLSTGLLQIENEFYSSIRPKRTTQSGETALQALRLHGVEYVEVRCIDLNPYEPLGITSEQIHLLDAFLLYCLLSESPQTSDEEYTEGRENQKSIVDFGRDPTLTLQRNGKSVAMQEWATEILNASLECAQLLDQAAHNQTNLYQQTTTHPYQDAVNSQFKKLNDPSLTPSARVIAELENKNIGFFEHTHKLAQQHASYFAERPLMDKQLQKFELDASKSLATQYQLEDAAQTSFEDYLANYYAQYHDCNCSCE
jgi:glutamate--cysteine ligase